MNTAVLFLLLLCQKQLFTCVKRGAVCAYVRTRKGACATLIPLQWSGRPHLSAPWASCTPPRGLRKCACPSLCHFSDFFRSHVCVCVYLLSLSHLCVSSTQSLLTAIPFSPSVCYGRNRASQTERSWAKLRATFPHWACAAADRWRYSLGTRWLRCDGSINEQQVRTGGG